MAASDVATAVVGKVIVEGVDESEPRNPFDTNAEVLPARRKGGAEKAPEQPKEKVLSKTKRRKIEQLAQKRATKELRTEVMKELKSVQLTSEQALLLRASQSAYMSRREQVALAQRRFALGLPLSPEQQKLRRRPRARGDKAEAEEAEEADEAEEKAGGASSSSAAAPPAPPPKTAKVAAVVKPPAAVASAKGKAPEIKAAEPTAPEAKATEAKAEGKAMPPAPVKAAPPLPTRPAPTPQPLHPVRVQRSTEIDEQRSRLPAVMVEQEVVEMVLENDVVLVCGDTGCGKSTQVPQFLYECGLCGTEGYLIGVTQPRRVAAISVSQRVGQELGNPGIVGYQVRYDSSHCTNDMRIKFMTDGILLREVQSDFLCKKYSVIIIDEAHERGVNCDILIGLLSRAVQRRRRDWDEAVAAGLLKPPGPGAPPRPPPPPPPLRLVVMSATLRHTDFTENRQLFPSPPPVMRIDARTFPVTVHFSKRTEEDYVRAAHKTVMQIHRDLPPGTILVFVTGRHEVHRLCRMLQRSLAALRAYGVAEELPDGSKAPDGAADDAEEDLGDEHLELLEGSDDEGNAFDDSLDDTTVQPSSESKQADQGEGEAAAGKKRKKRRRSADDPQSAAAAEGVGESEGPMPAKAEGKKKKRRKSGTSQEEGQAAAEQQVAVADEASAIHPETEAAPLGAGRKKKRKKGSAEETQAVKTTAQPSVEGQDKEEEREISFRLDPEEEVVVLDANMQASLAEDAKDAEALRQRRARMTKLDRSKTAGGAFRGSGFGEGLLRVVPLYAQLPARSQLEAFKPAPEGERVVVVATNVAETSITLPNVRYVVDTGQEKRRKYRASSGISAFTIERISKASADQRAGRAGRLGPGHAYRVYSSAVYEHQFAPFAPIAMLHTPLDPVLLLLAFLGVPRLDTFPWPTAPSPEAVAAAMRRLRTLGAIEDNATAAGGNASLATAAAAGMLSAATVRCTRLGFRLSSLPLAPRYAKMLLEAVSASSQEEGNIIGHACAIVAALSVGNIACWEPLAGDQPDEDAAWPGKLENELVRAQREAQKRLREAQGKEAPRWTTLRDDAEGLLWLLGGYAWALSTGEDAAERFCQENRVNVRQIAEAHSLMQQLGALLQRRLALDTIGLELELPLQLKPPTALQSQKLRECIVAGLLDRVAVACQDLGSRAYVCGDLGRETAVFVHSSSNASRHRPQPTILVFNEIISTTRPFMRDCIAVDPVVLARRATSRECPLLALGEFLTVPAPRYLKEQDQVMAFASPSYTPLTYTLPTVELNVPSDMIFRYKVFAKALLEGEVLPGIPPKGCQLVAAPALVLRAPTNPRVAGIVGPLWDHKVGSRAELVRRWAQDSRFLLEGYLKWLPASFHEDVRMSWPPIPARKR